MSTPPAWLEAAARKWRPKIIDEGIGRTALSRLMGETEHKARQVILYVKAQEAAAHKASAAILEQPEEEDADQDNTPTPDPKDSNDWLWEKDYIYNADTDAYVTFTKSTGKPLVMPGHKHRAILKAYSNWDGSPATINQICRDFGIPRPWLIEYLKIHGVTHDSEPFSAEEVATRDVDEMVEDALQQKRRKLYQQYEIHRWRDTKKKAEKWDKFELEVLDRLQEMIEDSIPEYTVPVLKLDKAKQPYALVLSPTDFHWGMYAWDGESGDPYDREEAERRLFEHTQQIINRLPGEPEKILLAVGSDWFHIDGVHAATTKGTPQDIDGTPTEILVTGCELVRSFVDLLRQVAPVEVFSMEGNHDAHNSKVLLLFLSAWYRHEEDVLVHKDWRPRLYTKYGNTLIGFHHGDKTPVKELGACMAREARNMWSTCKYHVFFGGHLHHHHVREIGGITHYQLPSLAGSDGWSSRHGYVTADPALVGYIVEKGAGPSGWVKSSE